jgi:hypothetical protein
LGSHFGTLVDGVGIDGRVPLAVGRQFAIGPMLLHLQRRPFSSFLSGNAPRDARTVAILLQTLD